MDCWPFLRHLLVLMEPHKACPHLVPQTWEGTSVGPQSTATAPDFRVLGLHLTLLWLHWLPAFPYFHVLFSKGIVASPLRADICGHDSEARLPCDLPVWYSLDLDAWINEPPSDSESEDEKPKAIFHDEEQKQVRHRQPEVDEEELARVSATAL